MIAEHLRTIEGTVFRSKVNLTLLAFREDRHPAEYWIIRHEWARIVDTDIILYRNYPICCGPSPWARVYSIDEDAITISNRDS